MELINLSEIPLYKFMPNKSWDINLELMTITCQGYEIDLERCRTAQEILDWIVQLQKKDWVDKQIVYDLVSILDDIFDIQGRIVHNSKPVGVRELRSFLRRYFIYLIKDKNYEKEPASSTEPEN